MNGNGLPETSEEARKKKKPVAIFWIVYFCAVAFFTFFPGFYPYHQVEPFIGGIPVHLFKWLISSVLLVGGMIVCELTAFGKWRGGDDE